MRCGLDYVDAEAGKPLDRIMWGDARDGAVNVGFHAGEIDAELVAVDADLAGFANGLRRFARRDQRLGWNATCVEAIAAHLVLLDEDDARAHLRRAGRHRQPAGPAANHRNVCDYPRHDFLPRPAPSPE